MYIEVLFLDAREHMLCMGFTRAYEGVWGLHIDMEGLRKGFTMTWKGSGQRGKSWWQTYAVQPIIMTETQFCSPAAWKLDDQIFISIKTSQAIAFCGPALTHPCRGALPIWWRSSFQTLKLRRRGRMGVITRRRLGRLGNSSQTAKCTIRTSELGHLINLFVDSDGRVEAYQLIRTLRNSIR